MRRNVARSRCSRGDFSRRDLGRMTGDHGCSPAKCSATRRRTRYRLAASTTLEGWRGPRWAKMRRIRHTNGAPTTCASGWRATQASTATSCCAASRVRTAGRADNLSVAISLAVSPSRASTMMQRSRTAVRVSCGEGVSKRSTEGVIVLAFGARGIPICVRAFCCRLPTWIGP